MTKPVISEGTMPTIDTAKGPIAYGHTMAKHGVDDPVLVFVHGAGGQRADWPKAWRSGIGDFKGTGAYALDLPGHGQSKGEGYDSIEAYADAVGAFLDAMQFKRAILVGHSMGAGIALELGARHHPRVVGVVVIAGAAEFFVHPKVLEGFKIRFEPTIEMMIDYSWPKTARESYKRQQRWHMLVAGPDTVHDGFFACSQFNITDRLGEIAVPVLVIAAENDMMVPLKKAAAVHEAVSDSRFVTVANSGHFPQIEKQAKCAAAIEAFCREINTVTPV